MNYAYIDPKYLSQAEVDIKEFFADIETPIKYDTFAELVAIDPKHEKQIKKQFKYITTEFSGCVKDMIDKIECLGRDMILKNEKHKNEINMLKKDNELLQKDNDLLTKDLEIAELRNEILRSKLK
jgi:uncharacterized protein YllA (UPF0747 family)